MQAVSDFLWALGSYEYLFFVVANDYDLQGDSLRPVKEAFARNLGERRIVIESFTGDLKQNYEKVLSKDWSGEDKQRLENLSYAKLLVISTNFSDFNPGQHKFAIIDFADYGGAPSAIEKVLYKIEQAIQGGEDFFDWWEANAQGLRLTDAELEQLRADPSRDLIQLLNSKPTFTDREAAEIAGVTERTIRNHINEPDRYRLRRSPQGRITQESLKEYLGRSEE